MQVRIYRIQRDIPMPLVTSGVEKGNLRELALARMGHLGTKCRDVRTREAGIQDIHHQVLSPDPNTRLLLKQREGASLSSSPFSHLGGRGTFLDRCA